MESIIPPSFFYMYHHYPFLSFKQIEFAHSDLTLLKAKEQGIILRTYSVTLTLIHTFRMAANQI